ncbi:transcription termination factor Rho, partial [Candidatus Roizmanbacteria bacterium CG23_combo_of_CG06-09_8_20_14_all_35_49]
MKKLSETKKTATVDAPIDVSSFIEKIEEKPIIPAPLSGATAGKPAKEVGAIRAIGTNKEVPLEERLKEDLKISYPAKGILDITFGGYGFLRHDYVLNPDTDIYVSTSQIRRFWLRRGDEVEGLARPPKEGERFHSLLLIKKINGVEMTEEQSSKRKNFDQLTSLHPNKQIRLETDKDILSTRIIDLIAPIGFGQRALIVSQPKAGKTTFLKEFAEAIAKNYPKVYLMAILIGERPEEVTEIKRFIKG